MKNTKKKLMNQSKVVKSSFTGDSSRIGSLSHLGIFYSERYAKSVLLDVLIDTGFFGLVKCPKYLLNMGQNNISKWSFQRGLSRKYNCYQKVRFYSMTILLGTMWNNRSVWPFHANFDWQSKCLGFMRVTFKLEVWRNVVNAIGFSTPAYWEKLEVDVK